jgi:hypothetical protein
MLGQRARRHRNRFPNHNFHDEKLRCSFSVLPFRYLRHSPSSHVYAADFVSVLDIIYLQSHMHCGYGKVMSRFDFFPV